jgi:HK97 family phage prohead protease
MGKITREIGLELCGLRLREAEGEQESRVIEGHAAVFGQRSVNLVPWSLLREVYEVLEPGSIDNELISRSDVVLTAYHNNEKILGRSVNGKGTLELSIDDKGLAIRCELPNTRTADEMLELIKRGDVTGMSFAYTADEEDNENGVSYENTGKKSAEGKDIWIRHVKKCNGLYDVTIAGHPAYPQTDVKQREVGEEMLKRIDAEAVPPSTGKAMPQSTEAAQSTGNSAQVVREIREALEFNG